MDMNTAQEYAALVEADPNFQYVKAHSDECRVEAGDVEGAPGLIVAFQLGTAVSVHRLPLTDATTETSPAVALALHVFHTWCQAKKQCPMMIDAMRSMAPSEHGEYRDMLKKLGLYTTPKGDPAEGP